MKLYLCAEYEEQLVGVPLTETDAKKLEALAQSLSENMALEAATLIGGAPRVMTSHTKKAARFLKRTRGKKVLILTEKEATASKAMSARFLESYALLVGRMGGISLGTKELDGENTYLCKVQTLLRAFAKRAPKKPEGRADGWQPPRKSGVTESKYKRALSLAFKGKKETPTEAKPPAASKRPPKPATPEGVSRRKDASRTKRSRA